MNSSHLFQISLRADLRAQLSHMVGLQPCAQLSHMVGLQPCAQLSHMVGLQSVVLI
jgi:hypothetical protein